MAEQKKRELDKYGDEKATPKQWIIFIIVVILVVGFFIANLLNMLGGDDTTSSQALIKLFQLI